MQLRAQHPFPPGPKMEVTAPLFLSVLHFKVDIVEIAEAVLVSLFLLSQRGHFIDFLVVHNLQDDARFRQQSVLKPAVDTDSRPSGCIKEQWGRT